MRTCPRCGTRDDSGRLQVCPRCLLLDPLDEDALPVLGPSWLQVRRELGRGGMGRVFLAHDQRLGRDVAVKVLGPEGSSDPDFRERFVREAKTLARLEHPGIVSIYDFGATPLGESYLVMQLVSGGSLAERPPLAVAEAVALVRQVCEALAYAHGRGIVHRDIKPENVLVADDGRAKLSDFGIARLLHPEAADHPLTTASKVLGTPGYMAPEARQGAPPDPRMDVYAAGALLLHLVTGRHPGLAPDSTTGAPLPAPVSAVIARAMDPNPVLRTPSAEALRADLDVVAARLEARGPRRDDLPPEERTWRGAVALLAAVATAMALYAVLVSVTPRAVAAEDVLPFTVFGDEHLPDGRVLTRARFEVWPTLGAAVAIAFALLAHGLLRRHWRIAGFDRPYPERPIAGAGRVFRVGAVLFGLFLLREGLERAGFHAAVNYVPVLGGCLELAMLYLLWEAALEAQQTGRALAREPLLWTGLVLALFPPVYHTARLVLFQVP